tara:strand:- start:1034 stop:1750 length:717 start_codon:yes stop_codon:yes gene_type:complete
MRVYKVNGVYHKVYDTIEEAPSLNVKDDWRKGKIGDWVKADDDSIIQVLRKGKMGRKNGEVFYIGTCTGTFIAEKSVYMDTDKRANIYSFGGNSTPEEIVQNRKGLTSSEEMFVTYVSSGMAPEDAYVKAFPTNNKRYARVKAVNLIKTKRIKTAMKEELKPILEEVGINEDYILRGIKAEADMADKADTRLKALFKLSDIMDLEDKNAPKVQTATAIQFKGFTDDMLDTAERPKEIE